MADAAPPPAVLHVITSLGLGGAENALTTLLTRTALGHATVGVVSLVPGGANADRLRAAAIPTSDLGMRPGCPDPRAISHLARLIRARQPAIVQSWMYHADLLALAATSLSGRRNRPRLVWGVRCSDMDVSRYGPALRWTIKLSAWLSRRPDALIVNSHAGWAVHAALGYRPKHVEVISNGIDLDRYHPDRATRRAVRQELGIDEDAVVVANVARRDPMKDHESFLAALATLPEVTALAIGLGTETLPGRPNLRRLGARVDVPRLLAACDIIASSSAFGEGFSNALAEGMAAGLIPVATDVGDSRLIVGDTGPVIPPRDPRALAEAIGRVSALPSESRERGGLQARARIESNFTLGKASDSYMNLYRSLI